MADTSINNQEIMQRVFSLAEKGLQSTQPNPRVGCVIVNGGEIVGEGYTKVLGSYMLSVKLLRLLERKLVVVRPMLIWSLVVTRSNTALY